MTRQDRATKLQPGHKNGHKKKPIVLFEATNEAPEVFKPHSGLINTSNPLTSTSGQPPLVSTGLQTVQRQALASQIGLTQGNWYLQRFMGSLSRIDRQLVQRIPDPTDWSERETRAIQRQLRRLGLYQMRVDGLFGRLTESGLVEAFGGDEWRTLEPDGILERLRVAVPASGRRGEHSLRYGEMFRDGILDMTLGLGYDELRSHEAVMTGFRDVLSGYGFVEDNARAVQALTQAGRSVGQNPFGLFFIRDTPLVYRPVAGAERQINIVVRFVFSQDGTQGGEAAQAFRQGMVQSDVTFYGGHGRYGSGPDFDRNMSFELLDRRGVVTETIEDYEVLERRLRDEGRPRGRSAWRQFLWRNRNNRIRVIGSNAGNVFLNPANLHQGEFGANLMYWNLRRTGGQGTAPVTGRGNELATQTAAHPERRYRLWVFDGCRTRDYERSIRRTPGLGTGSTDVIESSRSLYWSDITNTLSSFLNSVLNQQSAEQIIRGMDAQQVTNRPAGRAGRGVIGTGLQDNPTHR